MAQWQTDEAGRRLNDLVSAACDQGPQIVMRNDNLVAVVLSPDDYRRLIRQADENFGRLLEKSGLGSADAGPAGSGLSIAV